MVINSMFVIVSLLFLLFIILGGYRGLFKSVFKLLAGVLAMALAYFLAPLVGSVIINSTQLDDGIEKTIKAKIEKSVEDRIRKEVNSELESTLGIPADKIDQNIVDTAVAAAMKLELSKNQQIELINNIKAPDFIKTALIENNHDDVKEEMGVKNFYDYVARYITYMIINALSFGLTYFVAVIIFFFISAALAAAVHLPIVGTINRVGGMAFGACEALLIVWIMFTIISFSVNSDLGMNIYNEIMENNFLSTLYEKNVLNGFITGVTKLL